MIDEDKRVLFLGLRLCMGIVHVSFVLLLLQSFQRKVPSCYTPHTMSSPYFHRNDLRVTVESEKMTVIIRL